MTNNEIILGIFFITAVLLILVAGIVVSFHIANRQRLQKNLKLQQAALDYERELRAAESAVSESVMGHISRELHDNVGHIFTRLRHQIELKMLETENEQLLMPIQQTVVAASDQLRLISRTLSPEFLQNNDLLTSIRVETERLRLLKMFQVELRHPNHLFVELNKEQQLLCFRIFQEAITNVIKHAEAKTVTVSLQDSEGFLMSIRDDGKGFRQNPVAENGIRNMLRRAELANLHLNIESSPGQGTEITLRFLPNP